MENNHSLGVTPRSCHAESLMALAERSQKLNPVACVLRLSPQDSTGKTLLDC